MKIWVDADACPKKVKNLLFRTAKRVQISVVLVANQPQLMHPSEYIESILVPGGIDRGDEEIIALVQPGDLVITADIPFAASVIKKEAYVITPKGQLFTEDNISERLGMRNLVEELRDSGMVKSYNPPFTQKDCQTFSNQLDRFLNKRLK